MVDVLLTTATPGQQDGTYALVKSMRRHHPGVAVAVVVAEDADVADLDAVVWRVDELVAREQFAVTAILDTENQAAYALPFALERAIAQYGSAVFIAPGCLVANRLDEVARMLEVRSLALVSSRLGEEVHSRTPHLHTLTRRSELLSPRVVAVRTGAEAHLGYWGDALRETFIDVFQRTPRDVTAGILGMLVAGEDVGICGARTLMSWVDFAAVQSGRAKGPDASVIACDQLLAASRAAAKGDAEEVEVEWQLLADNVHDSRPLEPLVSLITEAVHRRPIPERGMTPFESFALAIRRASDPLGLRWKPGDAESFLDWLYDRNPQGLTRIAHLYWRTRPDLMELVPRPTLDPSGLIAWNGRAAFKELGMDTFDRSATPVVPRDDDVETDEDAGGVRNAVMWRINIIRGLLPGYEARVRRQRLGEDPREKRGVAPPRRVPVDRAPSVFGTAPRQLSLIGCFRSESGLGQAARASLAALHHLGQDFSWIDTSEMYPSRNGVEPDLRDAPFGALGDVNLLHSNADELITLGGQVFRHRLAGRFNAAMWFWETADLPERSRPAFDFVDELWVASEYLADVFGQYGKVPVRVIGLAAELPKAREVDRASLGLSADEFTFLFVYDALSAHGRKNPEKALQAFIKAFAPRFEGVRFVLKVSNLNKFPASQKKIRALIAGNPAITLIDEYLSREQVMDLMAAADVYVSLHAAEGFGLTLLEAMALGTPTICTAYSGNMDFCNDANAWLVDYTMMETKATTGPYPPGSVWASPNVDSAAALMRAAASNAADVARKREQAIRDAVHAASLERYAQRLGTQLRRVL